MERMMEMYCVASPAQICPQRTASDACCGTATTGMRRGLDISLVGEVKKVALALLGK